VNIRPNLEHSSEALMRATEHWEARRQAPSAGRAGREFTIALSRETGARGTSVARELGRRLGWAVYDQELLKLIAQEMGLRENLLHSVDERHVHWLRESIEAWSLQPVVSGSAYVRQLIETVFSLGAHGQCIIVGRGTAFLLPRETTLRVRLIAPLADRVEFMGRELNLSHAEAEKRVRSMDRDREHFVQEYFRKDAADPVHYDLLLNMANCHVADAAELIALALQRRQAQVPQPLIVAGV
jgi:cytidylate kinase